MASTSRLRQIHEDALVEWTGKNEIKKQVCQLVEAL